MRADGRNGAHLGRDADFHRVTRAPHPRHAGMTGLRWIGARARLTRLGPGFCPRASSRHLAALHPGHRNAPVPHVQGDQIYFSHGQGALVTGALEFTRRLIGRYRPLAGCSSPGRSPSRRPIRPYRPRATSRLWARQPARSTSSPKVIRRSPRAVLFRFADHRACSSTQAAQTLVEVLGNRAVHRHRRTLSLAQMAQTLVASGIVNPSGSGYTFRQRCARPRWVAKWLRQAVDLS